MRTPQLSLLGIGMTLLTVATALAGVQPPGTGHYTGAGVIVTSVSGNGQALTVIDNGAVVCRDDDGNAVPDHGTGGVCIRFEDLAGDAIYVKDAIVPMEELAFQVCVDNDGDGVCGGPNTGINGGCKDLIVFSHESVTGANHNPLYVNPVFAKNLWVQCGQKGFPGLVVITCAGVHAHQNAPGDSHTHQVTDGTAGSTPAVGTGQGNFCGGPTAAKAYVVL